MLISLGSALQFALNTVTFLASAALLRAVPGGRPPRDAGASLGSAIAEGARWIREHRLIRTLALLLGGNTLCFQLGNVTGPAGHRGPAPPDVGYGVLLGVAAVGGGLGGLLDSRLVDALAPSLVLALGVVIVAFVGIGFAPNPVLLGLLRYATTLWNVNGPCPGRCSRGSAASTG